MQMKFSKKIISRIDDHAAVGEKNNPSGADCPITKSADNAVRVALLADSQVVITSERHRMLKAALQDIEKHADAVSAVVLAGDITESGDDLTDAVVMEMLRKLPVRKIISSGNHDVRFRYRHTMKRFIHDVNTLACADYEVIRPYYCTQIEGYSFIVLGTEKRVFEKAYLSEQQLDFLDRMLKKGTADGKPAFVVNHQPLAFTHGLPAVWRTGDIGEQSDRVAEIMEKYPNVFFLTGHMHHGFGKYSFDSLTKTRLVSIPSVGPKATREFAPAGQGFLMEIYADRVVFRSRIFSDGEYYGGKFPEFDRTFYLE